MNSESCDEWLIGYDTSSECGRINLRIEIDDNYNSKNRFYNEWKGTRLKSITVIYV